MKREYTIKHKVYDGFGFIGINTHTVIADSMTNASKAARSTIAGQYHTALIGATYRYIKGENNDTT